MKQLGYKCSYISDRLDDAFIISDRIHERTAEYSADQ